MAKFVLIALAITASTAFAQLRAGQSARPSPFGSGPQNPLFAPFTLPGQPPASDSERRPSVAPPPAKSRTLSNDERIRQLEQEVKMLKDEVTQLKNQTELQFRELN